MTTTGKNAKIAVVGGGSFGWGLALAAERAGREVLLWSRRPQREGTPKIHLASSLAELARAELVFFAVPSPVMPALARELGVHLDGAHYLVHVSRGIVGDELQTLSQVLRTCTPCRRVGALAGPLVAQALADGGTGRSDRRQPLPGGPHGGAPGDRRAAAADLQHR
jgi:glycerol-3-phosphate dehydrogenase (NAD(P)+)